MPKYNDLDLSNWKRLTDIYTDSLWLIDKRDNTGVHTGEYHGNFIPQIPYQLLNRYTKKGEWVLDPFAGSGTTLIEAQRLSRNSLGIELQKEIASDALKRIKKEHQAGIQTKLVVANSQNIDLSKILGQLNISKIQFVLMHPPYWDIIKFSSRPEDLSNAPTIKAFKQRLGKVIDNTTRYLEKDRYCALVIGDKYAHGQIVPLGFECMQLFLDRNFILKAIIVKNFGETKGKAHQQAIWRYRALAADYYIFKHEYIMVFKKIK